MLKAIRDKFNLMVYFKLVTHKLVRQVDSEMAPGSLKIAKDGEVVNVLYTSISVYSLSFKVSENGVLCDVSSTILNTVDTVWGDDVFLYPIADKLWDFTLRLLGKHLAWARTLIELVHFVLYKEVGSLV